MASKEFAQVTYSEKGFSWSCSPDLCKSCGLCIEKCPAKCLSFDESQVEYLGMPLVKCNIRRCIACRTCERACPECAIVIIGKK